MKRIVVFILALTMIFSASSISFATDSYTEYFSKERDPLGLFSKRPDDNQDLEMMAKEFQEKL